MVSGGYLYLSTNGIGRYIYDIIKRPNPAPDFDPRKFGALTFWNTMIGRRRGLSPQAGGVITGQSRIIRLLQKSGFEIVDYGSEGCIMGGRESFLPGYYCGLSCTFDVLARKT
jgi:hypothetical protein